MCSLSYDQTSSASAKDVVELRVKQIQLVSRFFYRRLRSDLRHKSMFRLVMLQFASGRPLIPISCMNYHRKDSACPLLLICAQQPLGTLFPNLECLQLSDSQGISWSAEFPVNARPKNEQKRSGKSIWYNSCEGLGVLWELVILQREKSVAIHQSVTCSRQLYPTTTCPQWQMSLCFMS